MKTLVFAFDVEKLTEPEFESFFQKLFDAQNGVSLGLCKYAVFDTHGTLKVMDKLDELRAPDGHEIPEGGVHCVCPMCEHHRSAEQLNQKKDP